MIEKLKSKFECIENASLLNYNTYRLDTKCKLLVFPRDVFEFQEIMYILNGSKHFILGNGSNIILPDYYDGVVIKFKYFNNYNIFDEYIEVDSGVMINKLSMELSKLGYKGFEWASGIPGTIGGCIYNNAGCYGSEISDNLIDVTVFYDNKIYCLRKDELAFSYRNSTFKMNNKFVILKAKFKYEKGDPEELLDLIKVRTNKRIESQPLEYPSCGSVFRNPEGLVAGKLIDEANLKGKCVGGAMVSNKHANFIINNGNATPEDIIKLINEIKDTIKKNYNIDLVLEQEIIK